MKKILSIIGKLLLSALLLIGLIVCAFSVSPIFRFSAPEPFHGPDIYNPYDGLPAVPSWKRANFHTHTRVDGILNECPDYAHVVYRNYMRLGYDILSFSNHNELTRHPYDSTLQINVYEHGYSLFKFHKLVFNPSRMLLYDHLLPVLASQRQWQLDYLSRNADFVVMNHPDRTLMVTGGMMRKLSGYRMIEADCGVSNGQRRWDEALGAGHYSHCMIGDDCHDSGRTVKIARRCVWMEVPSAGYEDVRQTLLKGCFYSMCIPDFGNGDWDVKIEGNSHLPRMDGIGVKGDTVFVRLSSPARIEAVGTGQRILAYTDGSECECVLGPDEPYVRFRAAFDNGVTIYSNVFARYDSSVSDSPYRAAPHSVNWLLTVLFNAALLALSVLICLCIRGLWAHKELKS